MNNKSNNKQYEGIKQKLLKLQALADRGYKGETYAAQQAIERICQQYNIRLEDILDTQATRWYTFETGRSKAMQTLFMQCYAKVMNVGTMSYKQIGRNRIGIELTALQYAELSNMFEWHKENFTQELEDMKQTFLEAYISKHNIYRDAGDEDSEEKELTMEDIQRLRKMLVMRETLSDRHYNKMLECTQG